MSLAYKICRWAMGGIFVWAGIGKISDLAAFSVLIDAYGLVPEVLLLPTALTLSLLEIIGGIGLIVDIRGSLAVITGLLVLFIVVLGYAIWLGLDVDCGCFGPEDPESRAFHGLRISLYRDLVLMSGIVFIYGFRKYASIEPVRVNSFLNKQI